MKQVLAWLFVIVTLTIRPNPPSPDGTILVVGSPPYLEQRCSVAANACTVQLNVSAAFAQNGGVTIREASEKTPGNGTYWVHVDVAPKAPPPKRRAVRR